MLQMMQSVLHPEFYKWSSCSSHDYVVYLLKSLIQVLIYYKILVSLLPMPFRKIENYTIVYI
jgi:hypothetical protein